MTNVEKIIVLDYGSQYNQLITRRIREFGVFSELLSHRITAEEVKAMNPKGIILSVPAKTAQSQQSKIQTVTSSASNSTQKYVIQNTAMNYYVTLP